jgi:hypothetical protein
MPDDTQKREDNKRIVTEFCRPRDNRERGTLIVIAGVQKSDAMPPCSQSP